MVEKGTNKKKKRTLKLRSFYIVCFVFVFLISFIVYCLSFDSKAHILSCEGNYYLTDSQIYDLAKVSTNTRVILTSDAILENRVYDMPLVKKVNVTRSDGKISFDVTEKVVIGYYVKNDKNYMLTTDNESIPIEEEYLKTIIHFPLLSDFSAKQRKQICEVFKENEDLLTRSVIEKIAEMVPYKTSFDKNMIKMTMQDGNVVYTSISSLPMMANYQAMLTKLQGESVCLQLDADNSAIEKVDCSEFGGKKSKKKDKDDSKDSSDTKEKDTTDDASTDTENTDQSTLDGTTDDIYSQDGLYSQDVIITDDGVSDWADDDSTGLKYSASTDRYLDPSTGEQYQWNDQTQMFDVVSE